MESSLVECLKGVLRVIGDLLSGRVVAVARLLADALFAKLRPAVVDMGCCTEKYFRPRCELFQAHRLVDTYFRNVD